MEGEMDQMYGGTRSMEEPDLWRERWTRCMEEPGLWRERWTHLRGYSTVSTEFFWSHPVSPGWRCSWTCRCDGRWPGRSWWGRHTCTLLQGRAGRGCCSPRCLSGMGDQALRTRERGERAQFNPPGSTVQHCSTLIF